MAWDRSPWAVEAGQSSADIARLLAYLATGGAYGVHGPLDLRVFATPVPGEQVMVFPGSATIPNRAAGKTDQSYIGSNPTPDYLTIPATGSQRGRSDLLVARVENPISGEPWNPSEDPLNEQYIYTRRYPDVPPSTTDVEQIDPGASAITLSRLTIPANTGTITNTMITDLRDRTDLGDPPVTSTPMASANQDRYFSKAYPRSTTDDVLAYTQRTYRTFPATDGVMVATIPRNATEAVVDVRLECEQRPTPGQATNLAHCWGVTRVRMEVPSTSVNVAGADVEFDKDYHGGGTPTSVSIPSGATLAIPATARGKAAIFRFEAAMYNDNNTRGRLVVGRGAYLRVHIHFNVRPSSS